MFSSAGRSRSSGSTPRRCRSCARRWSSIPRPSGATTTSATPTSTRATARTPPPCSAKCSSAVRTTPTSSRSCARPPKNPAVIHLPFRSPAQFEPLCFTEAAGEGYWFVFAGDKLLVEMGPLERPSAAPRVRARPAWAKLPLQKNHDWLGAEPARTLYLGRLGGVDCWAAELGADAPAPAGMAWEGLRPLFSVLDDDHFALAGRALQLLEWDRTNRFCGRCGTQTEPKREERVRVCPACKLSAYPRVAPAVMALVRRENRILLARSPHFPAGMYSALAGFVEPGESLEQCLAREVAREVGVGT